MLEEKRPLKVFLCHAHSDKNAVRDLYLHLIKDGIDAWLDKEKLLPGQDWEREIRKAVRESDVVVVCLSKQFNQAGFRQKEVRLALDTAMEKPEGEIFIIPARLDECDTLESLQKWHWVDLFEENGYQNLIRALSMRAAGVGRVVSSKTITNTKLNESSDKPNQNTSSVGNKSKPRQPWRALAIGTSLLAVFCAFCLIIWGLPYLKNQLNNPTASPTMAVSPDTKVTATLTETISITNTPVASPTAQQMDVPSVLIPAGEFTMGSENGNDDEKPVHSVYLDAFYIDQYEVTNVLYRACVDDGGCQPPKDTSSWTRSGYFDNSSYDNYPVIYVNWAMANAYCQWRGARLPTEAEWEKAARGTDQRTYPWGEDVSKTFANYGEFVGDTTAVGSYKSGKSFYGVYDMAGNVWEWVADWYSDAYYQVAPPSNPLGPDSGNLRVLRGGSKDMKPALLRTTARGTYDPNGVASDFGFRCAKTTTP